MSAMPLPKVPGTRAARVSSTRGAKPYWPEDADQRRRLALAGAGHDGRGRRRPRGCCSWRRLPSGARRERRSRTAPGRPLRCHPIVDVPADHDPSRGRPRRHRDRVARDWAARDWVRPAGPVSPTVWPRSVGPGAARTAGPRDPAGPAPRPPPRPIVPTGAIRPAAPHASDRGRPSRATPRPAAGPGRAPGPASRPPAPGPVGPDQLLGARRPAEDAGEGAVVGNAVDAGRRHHDDPAVGHHPLGRGHALDRLVEVAVEGVAAVGGEHHVEPAVDRLGDACRRRRRRRPGGRRAAAPAKTPVRRRRRVDGHVDREIGRAQGGGGARRTRGPDCPSVTSQVDRVSAMRAGLWASRMVEVAARPGQAPLGPPLQPAKKWGSTKPVRMRTVGLDVAAVEEDRARRPPRPPATWSPSSARWSWIR